MSIAKFDAPKNGQICALNSALGHQTNIKKIKKNVSFRFLDIYKFIVNNIVDEPLLRVNIISIVQCHGKHNSKKG